MADGQRHRQGTAREDRPDAAGVLGGQLGGRGARARPRSPTTPAARCRRQDPDARRLRDPGPRLRLVLRRRRRRERVRAWIDTVAPGIQGNPYVVLEPDALAQLGDCAGQGDRVGFLKYAAKSLTLKGARVYIDVGHSSWLPVSTAVEPPEPGRLRVRGRLRAQHVELPDDGGVQGLRPADLAAARGEEVRHRHVPQRQRLEWAVVQPERRALGDRPTLVNAGSGLDASCGSSCRASRTARATAAPPPAPGSRASPWSWLATRSGDLEVDHPHELADVMMGVRSSFACAFPR